MDDAEFRLKVKKMICLAFVPIDDVIFAFEALRKEDPSEEFQSLSDYSKTLILVPVEEIDASNQSLTLPIGTFSIGCSVEKLVRTKRWRHRMAASINSYRQSIQPSPS